MSCLLRVQLLCSGSVGQDLTGRQLSSNYHNVNALPSYSSISVSLGYQLSSSSYIYLGDKNKFETSKLSKSGNRKASCSFWIIKWTQWDIEHLTVLMKMPSLKVKGQDKLSILNSHCHDEEVVWGDLEDLAPEGSDVFTRVPQKEECRNLTMPLQHIHSWAQYWRPV